MMTQSEWDDVERRIARAWKAGATAEALEAIESVLHRGNDEQRGRALLYRGSVQEEAADWRAARNDFIEAAGLFNAGTYPRYTAELSAGGGWEKAGETREAVKWYRAALFTCADAKELFSGAAALKALLALVPELSRADQDLARIVTAKSWSILNVPDQPNLDDLAGAVDILMQRASNSNG